MSVRWDRGHFDVSTLIERLQGLRVPPDSESGRDAYFEGDLFFEDMVSVLERALIFPNPIPEWDKRRIVNNALSEAARQGRLTEGTLLGQINRRVQAFVGREPADYVLATSLSFGYFADLPHSKEITGHRLLFGRDLPEHLRDAHETARQRMRRYVFGEYPGVMGPSAYCTVWVDARGRSEFEAVDEAVSALDLLRGIWNLSINRRRWTRTTNARRRPINQILLGPIHSLHRPDGSLALGDAWYEPDYLEPTPSREPRRKWDLIRREEATVQEILESSAYRETLEAFIRRYVRALDTREWDAAFIHLWGLLEDLTGTTNHDTVIKRASFQYVESERLIHVQVLKHLKDYRNRSVHEGEGSEDIEAYLYQIKRYVEDLLKFHLESPHNFESVEEMAEFLDHPANPEAIERTIEDLEHRATDTHRRISLARQAREFRSGPPEGAEPPQGAAPGDDAE